MTRSEMETTIVWDDDEKLARIWTCSPITIRKLDKLTEELPDVYKLVAEEAGGTVKRYTVASRYISFRKPVTVTMSDEQKRINAERLRSYREKKQEGENP